MRLVKHNNGTVVDYPYTLRRLRAENPTSTIPDQPSAGTLARYGAAHVEEVAQPAYDSFTQSIREGDPIPNGESWVQTWVIESLSPEQIESNIEAAKAALMQAATDKRWRVMTGGITLLNGTQVGTTIDDQNRITSVVANAALAGLTDADEVDFKATSGWVRITIAQIKAIAGTIGQFVQACYSAERAHHDAIALLETREELNGYDVNSGWPDPVIETEPT